MPRAWEHIVICHVRPQVDVSPVTALNLLLELPPNTVNNTQRLSLLTRAFTAAQNMTVTTEFVEVYSLVIALVKYHALTINNMYRYLLMWLKMSLTRYNEKSIYYM